MRAGFLWLALTVLTTGCYHLRGQIVQYDVPSEGAKAVLPPYMIEPPDVLTIDALRLVPRPPYMLAPFDEVGVRFPAVPEYLKKEDLEDLLKTGRVIAGTFTVEPEGTINLGPVYGKVKVADMTIDKARVEVENRLKKITREKFVEDGKVFVELTQFRGMQQIRGDHLVRPDGTVSLGTYGSVMVAGLTLDQAKEAIEKHLNKYMLKPEVAVDVSGYNSKVYYVIFDGAGFGEQVFRFPVTGNETVLDAVANVNGLPPVAWKKRIWIARPTRDGEADQVMPVDWAGISRRAAMGTNYQVLPGDRLYVQAEPLITTDTYLGRFLAPFERIMGFSIFGASTVRTLQFRGDNGGFGSGGFGF